MTVSDIAEDVKNYLNESKIWNNKEKANIVEAEVPIEPADLETGKSW